MGIRYGRGKSFPVESNEIEYIVAHYGKIPTDVICNVLKRSYSAVQVLFGKHATQERKATIQWFPKNKKFTTEEIEKWKEEGKVIPEFVESEQREKAYQIETMLNEKGEATAKMVEEKPKGYSIEEAMGMIRHQQSEQKPKFVVTGKPFESTVVELPIEEEPNALQKVQLPPENPEDDPEFAANYRAAFMAKETYDEPEESQDKKKRSLEAKPKKSGPVPEKEKQYIWENYGFMDAKAIASDLGYFKKGQPNYHKVQNIIANHATSEQKATFEERFREAGLPRRKPFKAGNSGSPASSSSGSTLPPPPVFAPGEPNPLCFGDDINDYYFDPPKRKTYGGTKTYYQPKYDWRNKPKQDFNL